ncbi:MAG TPA: PKD domain-containing protein [Baekduia sp.]|nr:PKD domain-containing protein [Baekduia sp.]
MRRLVITTIMFSFAIPLTSANAYFFPSVAVDAGAITETGDTDLAPDGSGAITFVRSDAGVRHAYVNRLVAGQFTGSERVDPGLEGGSENIAIGAGNGGRLAVMFESGGTLFANVRPSAAAPWTGPVPIAAGGADPVVDMSVIGVGFAAYRVGTDVFSAWLGRGGTSFAANPGTLDVDQAKDAGVGNGRVRIAASAAGSAVAVWGEEGADTLQHVYMRRIFQGSTSTAPQDLTLPSLDGRSGLDADFPDVDIEDDASFAWVAFRQAFNDGGTTRTRLLVRHLRGATFEPAVAVDTVGWGEGVGEPRMDMNPRGEGLAIFPTGGGTITGATLKDSLFRTALPLGVPSSGPVGGSATAASFNRVAIFTEGSPPVVKGRFYADSNRNRTLPFPGPVTGLTSGVYGAVDTSTGFDVSGDTSGNVLALFAQGVPGNLTVVAAGYDMPPSKPTGLSKWTKSRRPFVTWKSNGDAWGPVNYRVEIGGKVVGQTGALAFQSATKLKYGKKYKFRVTGIDLRGQITRSSTVSLSVDTRAPSAKIKFKRNGRKVSARVTPFDRGTKKRPASGIAAVRINWGDGWVKRGVVGSHTFAKRGKKKVRVTITDKAGNSRTIVKRV